MIVFCVLWWQIHRMSRWLPIMVGGVTYDLAHLDPFTFDIVPRGWSRSAIVAVAFNDHCFTEKFDDARHTSPIVTPTSSGHETRGFSLERWRLSLELPDLIRNFDGKRVARTRNGNLVHLRTASGAEYGVFFTLRRSHGLRCALYVVSAYELGAKTARPAVTGEMRFETACALVLEGKPLRFPGRR